MVQVITRRALTALAGGLEKMEFPIKPVLLRGRNNGRKTFSGPSMLHTRQDAIVTTINGKTYRFESGQNKSLMRLLREDAQLIGTKEGCAEG
jgi:hypothetical protein